MSRFFDRIIPVFKKSSIGIVGAYTQDNLPLVIISKLSHGLTYVEKDGSIKPDLATGWKEQDNGKTYIFYLKPNQHYNNGKNLTSDTISYNFSDVLIEKPDKSTIIFKLKDAYSPFLVTASKPVFDKGYTGVGDYRIEDIKLNGSFVQTITLVGVKNKFDTIKFQFYPTEEALTIAFLLGEITQAQGLTNSNFKDTDFGQFANTQIRQNISSSRLVTLFYNTSDSALSDKKVRLGLSYGLPDNFPHGKKAYLPYSPDSVYYNKDISVKRQDYSHAKLLLASSNAASESADTTQIHLTIKTLKKYKSTADAVASSWKKAGINTEIEEVNSIPTNFQVFLGDFNLPKDPDQYSLWHSGQINNIARYKNLRIDKLLEDGRKTTKFEDRQKIYSDFQKYLMEDTPASFLYFPYEYDVIRK